MTDSAERREPWISPAWWAFGSLIVGFLLIYLLVGHLLTDRLTVHNRTTVPVSFISDAFGGYENDIGSCSSEEFAWRQDGSRSGWRPVGPREPHAGAMDIEMPVERWFEAGPADHFIVLVTSDRSGAGHNTARL